MRYLIIAIMSITFAFAGDAKPLPPEAQTAVDQMEATINKARRECLVKLNKCIMDITRTGNLEAAMVVKVKETEIQDAMPHVDLFGDAHGVVGKWKTSLGSIRDHQESGITIADGTIRGKWIVSNAKFIITWENGSVETYFLPVKNNILSGSNTKGQSFTITKVK